MREPLDKLDPSFYRTIDGWELVLYIMSLAFAFEGSWHLYSTLSLLYNCLRAQLPCQARQSQGARLSFGLQEFDLISTRYVTVSDLQTPQIRQLESLQFLEHRIFHYGRAAYNCICSTCGRTGIFGTKR